MLVLSAASTKGNAEVAAPYSVHLAAGNSAGSVAGPDWYPGLQDDVSQYANAHQRCHRSLKDYCAENHKYAGGAQEALTEHYNDQLRDLRAAGLAEEAGEFRDVLRQMRDGERAPLNHAQVTPAHLASLQS